MEGGLDPVGMHIFLIGGGRGPGGVRASHARFAAAAQGGPVVAYVLDEGEGIDVARWEGQLISAGARTVRLVAIDARRPADPADLDGAGGVYVAGGLTPTYHAVLVAGGTAWLERARELRLPYAGYSAGASIAAESAVVGGWRARLGERVVQVCEEDAGEGLDLVEAVPGLG